MQTAQEKNQSTIFYIPRLGEYVDAISRVMRELKNIGASPGQIIGLLKGGNRPPDNDGDDETSVELEIDLDINLTDAPPASKALTRQLYTAYQIAQELCILSVNGRPHSHAVSAILNNNLRIGEEHMEERLLFSSENLDVFHTLYDGYALECVAEWISDNELPYDIDGFHFTYHVRYYNL